MRWFRRCRSSLALAVLALIAAGSGCGQPLQEVTILHFNDYHGQVRPTHAAKGEPCGGLARLAALVGVLTAREQAKGRSVFLMFAGDAFTGTATSTLFQGEPDFLAFQKMGIDAMVPGNHDWDFGSEILAQRCRSLRSPILLANARPLQGAPAFFRPAVTLQAGLYRIGVIGVSREDTPKITRPGVTQGFEFENPGEAVARVLSSRGPAAWDFVVVLSHCGLEEDRRIARRNPGVGLIVGGHDHIALPGPVMEAGVPIVQAGDRGRYVGVVRLSLERGSKGRVSGNLIPVTADLPEDGGIRALVAPYLEREEREVGTVVASLQAPLQGTGSRQRPTPLGSLVADALREASGADAAFINGGAIRGDLPSGDITGRELMEALPFQDTLRTVRIKGQAMRALLDRCASHAAAGPWGGYLQLSGISTVYRDGRAQSILVGERPLEDEVEYLVACNGFLADGGDGYAEFASGREARDWGLEVRDLLKGKLSPASAEPGLDASRPEVPSAPGDVRKAA